LAQLPSAIRHWPGTARHKPRVCSAAQAAKAAAAM
jgi:hypothetical protein